MVFLETQRHAILFVKVNVGATAPPTANDDTNAGYDPGSYWIDTFNEEIYFCVDNTAGNAIWRRVAGTTEGYILYSTQAAVVASTTQSQGQQVLTGEIVEVGTVANPNDVVTLPFAFSGRECKIINNGAEKLQVFPNLSDAINQQALNTSYTITSGTSVIFSAVDSVRWYT